MTAVLIVGIVFGSIVAIFAIIFGFALLRSRVRKGGSLHQSEKINADETRLIQEIHKGLSRMEERVESLETILFDREMREASGKKGREEEK